jgi:hypothetical protein
MVVHGMASYVAGQGNTGVATAERVCDAHTAKGRLGRLVNGRRTSLCMFASFAGRNRPPSKRCWKAMGFR